MNKLGTDSKRPSARRAGQSSAASDVAPSEATGTIAKRVHARRASADGIELDAASEAPPQAASFEATMPTQGASSEAPPQAAAGTQGEGTAAASAEGIALDEAAAPAQGEGIAFDEAARPAAAPSSIPPAARVRARRPRASAAKRQAPSLTAAPAVPRAAEPPPASSQPLQPPAAEEPAALVEGARWAPLSVDDDFEPPSLDHADFADDFGLDPTYETKLRPWLESLCERHFHVELHGAQNIPAHGRALLVANHSRNSVWDGIVLRAALRSQHPAGRVPRWLVDDQQFHAPFLGTFVNRLGAVRACQENAERLLLREELVVVFPEGSKATDRPYEERHRLQRFGRGGFVKLALRTGTPVIPVAIVATEYEGAVWRNRLASASRVLSAPFAALRPSFPRIGMLAVPPMSARIRIYVGEPIAEISRQDASVTQDDGLVHELNECVRSAVQNLVNASLHA